MPSVRRSRPRPPPPRWPARRRRSPHWAALPLDERIARVTGGHRGAGDEKDRIVEELAWQMGRPTRFGGEFGGVNERTAYMAGIAERRSPP
jgi:hypothetical protein